MPVTFWTVEPGLRDQLAFWVLREDGLDEGYGAIAQLVPGQYDGHAFAEMLGGAMNKALEFSQGFYPRFEVLYVPSENRLGVVWGAPTDPPRHWAFISPEQVKGGLPVTWPETSPPITVARLADRIINAAPAAAQQGRGVHIRVL